MGGQTDAIDPLQTSGLLDLCPKTASARAEASGIAMQRREFITLMGSAAATWPAMARAQQDRVRRIGVLMGYAEADPDTQARMAAFKDGPDRLGWKDGRNVQITFRFGVGEMDRVQASAKQLVELNPDVIVCETTPTLKVLAQQTASLPIVFVSVADPVLRDPAAEAVVGRAPELTRATNAATNAGVDPMEDVISC